MRGLDRREEPCPPGTTAELPLIIRRLPNQASTDRGRPPNGVERSERVEGWRSGVKRACSGRAGGDAPAQCRKGGESSVWLCSMSPRCNKGRLKDGMIDIERVVGGMVRCQQGSSEGCVGGSSSGAGRVGWCGRRSPEGLLGGVKRLPPGWGLGAAGCEARACGGRAVVGGCEVGQPGPTTSRASGSQSRLGVVVG